MYIIMDLSWKRVHSIGSLTSLDYMWFSVDMLSYDSRAGFTYQCKKVTADFMLRDLGGWAGRVGGVD